MEFPIGGKLKGHNDKDKGGDGTSEIDSELTLGLVVLRVEEVVVLHIVRVEVEDLVDGLLQSRETRTVLVGTRPTHRSVLWV